MIIKGQNEVVIYVVNNTRKGERVFCLFFQPFFISDLLTEDSKMFLTIKLISGEVTAGDPLSGEGETDIGGALRKKGQEELLKIDHRHTQTKQKH